jgi:hypothetical protein
MEETQNTEIVKIHRRSRILFYCTVAGVISIFFAAGSILIATGELKQSVANSKEADASMLVQIKINTAELVSIKISQEKRDFIDSAFRTESRRDRGELRDMLKNVQTRLSRLEYLHKLPLEPSNLYNNKIYTPFDVSVLSLQNTQ